MDLFEVSFFGSVVFEIHPVLLYTWNTLTSERLYRIKMKWNEKIKIKRRKTSFCAGKNGGENWRRRREEKSLFILLLYSLHHHYYREMLLCVIFNLIKQSIEAYKKKQWNMLRLLCSISVNNYRKCDQIISIAVNRFFVALFFFFRLTN